MLSASEREEEIIYLCVSNQEDNRRTEKTIHRFSIFSICSKLLVSSIFIAMYDMVIAVNYV